MQTFSKIALSNGDTINGFKHSSCEVCSRKRNMLRATWHALVYVSGMVLMFLEKDGPQIRILLNILDTNISKLIFGTPVTLYCENRPGIIYIGYIL